jgi:protocatechuate 3,4-dioxygenase beta subunit
MKHHQTPHSIILAPGHDPHDLGLQSDLAQLQLQLRARRRALAWLGSVGLGGWGLAGCGGGTDASSGAASGSSGTSGSSSASGSSGTASCTAINEETAGPYPGDGSNTANGSVANVLTTSGVVRSDIRASIGGASGVAAGIPLTVRLTLVNAANACAALEGYAVYLWHCDALGRYSMYSSGVTAENYLRGVQASAGDGILTFQTIYPGCYDGRVPHMHFEVYRSLSSATSHANKLRTSQIAFPPEVSSAVYATSGYGNSAVNSARVSNATDGIFSDGIGQQLAVVTGNVTSGYTASLQVAINA